MENLTKEPGIDNEMNRNSIKILKNDERNSANEAPKASMVVEEVVIRNNFEQLDLFGNMEDEDVLPLKRVSDDDSEDDDISIKVNTGLAAAKRFADIFEPGTNERNRKGKDHPTRKMTDDKEKICRDEIGELENALDLQDTSPLKQESDYSGSDDDNFNEKGTSFSFGNKVTSNVIQKRISLPDETDLKRGKAQQNIVISGNDNDHSDDKNDDADDYNDGNGDGNDLDILLNYQMDIVSNKGDQDIMHCTKSLTKEDTPLVKNREMKDKDNIKSLINESTPLIEKQGANDQDTKRNDVFLMKKDTTLIKKEQSKDLMTSGFVSSPKMIKASAEKTKLQSQHSKSQIELIYAAEDCFLKNTVGKVDEETKNRCRRIAEAIFLDDPCSLKSIFAEGNGDIQRRILEAVELNSLKCLRILCEKYKQNRISSTKEDVILFHRRYGLSFWPLDERAKMTALHLLAKKFSSIKAMDVMVEQPEFLNDFWNVPDSDGSTPLLLAIKCNNSEIVKRLLPPKPENLNEGNQYELPLYVAALNDHADVIREIIKRYSGSNEIPDLVKIMKNVDGNNHSILYVASQSGKSKILDLVSEQTWCTDLLAHEKIDAESWKTFTGDVCAAGCKRLAKIILEQNRDLLGKKEEDSSDDYKTMVTPLMRAAEANQLEIVHLIFNIKADLDLLTINDGNGKNVFHYAVKNPGVLAVLISHYITFTGNYEAINKMDDSEDTPIMLAASEKVTESFEMLSNYAKKLDLFSARFIHRTDFTILEESLAGWKDWAKRGCEDTGACLLRGDHEEHQPFLEAARKGNTELMEFFLNHGANELQRTAKDQTVIHCAVLSGKLPAVQYLLNKNQFKKMIDFTDENDTTAAGYATQIGEAEILRCLLGHKAKMKKETDRLNILDSAYGYFKTGENSMKEIIRFCTKGKQKTKMLKELFQDSHLGADRIMSKLIEETPDVAMQIFDVCVQQNKKFTHRSYGETKVKEEVSYSFFPFKRKYPKKGPDGKLEAIESMVKSKRDDCLGHPLVIRFLNKKMCTANVQTWLVLNFLLYTTFLLTLTAYGAIQSQDWRNLKSPGMIALSIIVLMICAIHFTKEIFQMVVNGRSYAKNFENYIEWLMYVCAVVYVAPEGITKKDLQIAAGAISMFLGWINFSLFLQGFTLFGIYIIMAKRVFLTVCKVLPLVVLFIVAFSLSFSLLMPFDQGFKSIPLSLLTSFVMMTGEIDYRGTFLDSGPLHVLQKIFLVFFILMISITIMNLLTGLAVDDTNEIMKRSKEEKRMNKAQLVLTLEKALHDFKRISPMEIKEEKVKDDVPDNKDKNSQCSWFVRQWRKIYGDDELEDQLRALVERKRSKDND